MPLDYILRQMDDVMELVFAYDHDPSFVPNADQLVLFELIEKQFAGYSAMMLIIASTMRGRAREAGLAEIAAAVRCPRRGDERERGRGSAPGHDE